MSVRLMKVLLVDDNPRMRRAVRDLAGSLSYDFYEVSNGKEAVDAYRELRPDVVVMDIELGTMDGLTATKRIKEFDAAAKIIILTAYDTVAYREAALKAGAMQFVGKENLVSIRNLMNELQSHLPQ